MHARADSALMRGLRIVMAGGAALFVAVEVAPLLAGTLAAVAIPEAVLRAISADKEVALLVTDLATLWVPMAALAFVVGALVSRVLRCSTWPLALVMAAAWVGTEAVRLLVTLHEPAIAYGDHAPWDLSLRVAAYALLIGVATTVAVRRFGSGRAGRRGVSSNGR